MRARQKLVIDRHSGDAVLTTEVIDDDADAATRLRELRESVPDLPDVQARFATAACDGCGVQVELDFDNPRMPPRWAACEDGDFCPTCQALN